MIVSELLEKLKKAPQDYEIITEGCDCDGEVLLVQVRKGSKDVYLRRESKFYKRIHYENGEIEESLIELEGAL